LKYAEDTVPSASVALIRNVQRPCSKVWFETKCPGSNRISLIGADAPCGEIEEASALLIGCSSPDAWKNVKWTAFGPAEPGSTYPCIVPPPVSVTVESVGCPGATDVEICSGGSFVRY
jgi:hypothetical protein